MKPVRTPLMIAIGCLLFASAYPQAPASTVSKDERKKLSAWPGHWTGQGIYTMRGKEEKSTVDEMIQWRVDGNALLIDGLGKNTEGNVVHEALGVLWYDVATTSYKFRSWLRDGRSSESWFNIVGENQYQWGFDTPQGKIRYSINLTASTWNETGEYSADGKMWNKFMEMNLTRQPK